MRQHGIDSSSLLNCFSGALGDASVHQHTGCAVSSSPPSVGAATFARSSLLSRLMARSSCMRAGCFLPICTRHGGSSSLSVRICSRLQATGIRMQALKTSSGPTPPSGETLLRHTPLCPGQLLPGTDMSHTCPPVRKPLGYSLSYGDADVLRTHAGPERSHCLCPQG